MHKFLDLSKIEKWLHYILNENTGDITYKKFNYFRKKSFIDIIGKPSSFITRKEFWLIRGYSENESIEKIQNEQIIRSHKGLSKQTREKRQQVNPFFRKNVEKLFDNPLDVDKFLKLKQGRGDTFFKEKGLSDEAVLHKKNARNEKWQNSLRERLKYDNFNKRKGRTTIQLIEEKGLVAALEIRNKQLNFTYSNASIMCFDRIIEHLKLNREEVFYKENELILMGGDSYYKYDFTYRNLIIEYQGDYWHMNPGEHISTDFNTVIKKTAKEIWDKDTLKKKIAFEHGYGYIAIWESDWNKNSDSIIESIRHYYEKNHNQN